MRLEIENHPKILKVVLKHSWFLGEHGEGALCIQQDGSQPLPCLLSPSDNGDSQCHILVPPRSCRVSMELWMRSQGLHIPTRQDLNPLTVATVGFTSHQLCKNKLNFLLVFTELKWLNCIL